MEGGHRPADRGRARGPPRRLRLHGGEGRHHARLGRPVMVDEGEGERGAGGALQPVAAGQQGAQPEVRRQQPSSLGGLDGGQYLLGQRRGEEAEGDLLGRQPAQQAAGRERHLLVGDVQAGARHEGGPDLPHRGVEGGRGDQRGPVGGGHAVGLQVPVHQVEQPRLGDLHPLGTAGRSRGVDDVGEVARAHLRNWRDRHQGDLGFLVEAESAHAVRPGGDLRTADQQRRHAALAGHEGEAIRR